jgi:hypothetical protein
MRYAPFWSLRPVFTRRERESHWSSSVENTSTA